MDERVKKKKPSIEKILKGFKKTRPMTGFEIWEIRFT